jgi:glycosyltransferase involved in cell wall biosynthesis
MQKTYLDQSGLVRGFGSLIARSLLHYIRNWDIHSSQGVDLFVTNSDYVGRRIQKRYRRQATTIHPPVDTERFSLHEEKEDYYLTASRMVPYKRIDLIVEAFAKMPDRRLIVVGNGPEMEKIKAKAGPNVRLMGHEPADRLRRHMQLAKAFIFAAEEDFGIVPVEALACGTPVIAFNRGGVTETVIDGKTGIFFNEQSADSIVAAVERFETLPWDSRFISQRAAQFSCKRFRDEFTRYVKRHWTAFETDRMQNKSAIGMQDAPQAATHPAPPRPRLRAAAEVPGADTAETEITEIEPDDLGISTG